MNVNKDTKTSPASVLKCLSYLKQLDKKEFFLKLDIKLKMNSCWVFVSILLVVTTSFAFDRLSLTNVGSFCKDDIPHGTPNTLPIESGPPRLIRTVANGSLYQVGVGEDQSWLVHLWGANGYDYGLAYGILLAEQIHQLLPYALAHFEQEIIDNIDKIKVPEWFKTIVVDEGVAFALDMQDALVENYMDKEIYNELRGISDGAKFDYKTLVRVHMLGELTRGNISYEILIFILSFTIQLIVPIMAFGVRRHLVARLFSYVHLIGTPILICKIFQ